MTDEDAAGRIRCRCPGARARRRGWHSLRQQLIEVGDFSAYVLERCGEPDSRQVISGSIGANSQVVERWVYDFGSRQPLRILTIVGGRVTRIEDSSRSR